MGCSVNVSDRWLRNSHSRDGIADLKQVSIGLDESSY